MLLPTVAEAAGEADPEAEVLASPTTPAAEGFPPEVGTNTRVTFCALCEEGSREAIVLVGDGAGESDADTRVEDAVSDTAAAATLEEVALSDDKVDVGIEEDEDEASTSAALTDEVAEAEAGEDEDEVDDPTSEPSVSWA